MNLAQVNLSDREPAQQQERMVSALQPTAQLYKQDWQNFNIFCHLRITKQAENTSLGILLFISVLYPYHIEQANSRLM